MSDFLVSKNGDWYFISTGIAHIPFKANQISFNSGGGCPFYEFSHLPEVRISASQKLSQELSKLGCNHSAGSL